MRRRLTWLDIVPETLAALAVLAVGWWEAHRTAHAGTYYPGTSQYVPASHSPLYALVIALAVAVGLCRHLPSASLALVVLIGLIHLEAHLVFLVVELAVCVVMFGAARWGRPVTAALALGLVPLVGLASLVVLNSDYFGPLFQFLPRNVADALYGSSRTWRTLAAIAGGTALVLPWLIGLVARLLARAISARDAAEAAALEAQRARRETAQAQEIARLRDGQAQLARDVHDVVGHSLAVILAQAESGQYARDEQKLKTTLATIADSARSSLHDVRRVLRNEPARPGGLEELIDGVRAAGHEVTTTVTGTPHPLPPELETVTYRVLQEMLTNALRHGRRGGAVAVTMDWGEQLTLRTANPAAGEPGPRGAGLDGMQRRVEAVGGRLVVEPGDPFVVLAVVPVRPR